MAQLAESAGISGGLALHHRGCPHQAKVPLPIDPNVTVYLDLVYEIGKGFVSLFRRDRLPVFD